MKMRVTFAEKWKEGTHGKDCSVFSEKAVEKPRKGKHNHWNGCNHGNGCSITMEMGVV